MCTLAITVWGRGVKVRSCSYGTYDGKSLEEDVLMRKQVCADEAKDRSQSTFEIPMDFGQQRISACPQEEEWAPGTSHLRSTLDKAE